MPATYNATLREESSIFGSKSPRSLTARSRKKTIFIDLFLWHIRCGGTETVNRKLSWLLTISLLALAHLAVAQQPGRFYRIGYLSNGDGNREQEHALQKGLRERGYTDG
jgi:hypothetical protein